MLAARSLRVATGASARVAVPVRTPVVTRIRTLARATPSDPAALKDAALDAAYKAAEALKNVDVDKVKGQLKDAATVSVDTIKKAIDTALGLWSSYDADKDGKLSIKEAVTLLNSQDVADAVTKLTGQPHTVRTEADIKKWFNRADFDKSGTLSKREFTVMYAGLLADKAKVGAKGLAQMVCTALDSDGDGTIGSDEFKALLQNSPLAPVANVIPAGKNVNYRDLLGKI